MWLTLNASWSRSLDITHAPSRDTYVITPWLVSGVARPRPRCWHNEILLIVYYTKIKQVSGVGGLATLAKRDCWQARPLLTLTYHIISEKKKLQRKIQAKRGSNRRSISSKCLDSAHCPLGWERRFRFGVYYSLLYHMFSCVAQARPRMRASLPSATSIEHTYAHPHRRRLV